MPLPLVSIMIPAYNQPQYIMQAVQSALAQNYENLEVVVSDDSTNEKTAIILQDFLSDKRFFYHKNPVQLGRVANYIKLLNELARGEWVVMLDGDDYYIDNAYISEAIQIITTQENIILAGATMKVLHEATGTEDFYRLAETDVIFDGKKVFDTYKNVPAHQTAIYPRALAQQLNFYRDSSAASDSESLYRLCLHGNVAYIAKPVAVWRIHTANTTYTRNLGKQIKELLFIDKIYNYALAYLDKAVADNWRKNMFNGMCAHLLNLAFTGKRYRYVLIIVFRYGNFLGWKMSIVHLLQVAGFYRKPVSSIR